MEEEEDLKKWAVPCVMMECRRVGVTWDATLEIMLLVRKDMLAHGEGNNSENLNHGPIPDNVIAFPQR